MNFYYRAGGNHQRGLHTDLYLYRWRKPEQQPRQVLTQGAANLDFTDASTGTCTTTGPATYSAGDTCTVDVTFTPAIAGHAHGSGRAAECRRQRDRHSQHLRHRRQARRWSSARPRRATLGGGFNSSRWRGGGRQRQRLCCRYRQQRGEGDARRLRFVQLRDDAGRRLQRPRWRGRGRRRQRLCRRLLATAR